VRVVASVCGSRGAGLRRRWQPGPPTEQGGVGWPKRIAASFADIDEAIAAAEAEAESLDWPLPSDAPTEESVRIREQVAAARARAAAVRARRNAA